MRINKKIFSYIIYITVFITLIFNTQVFSNNINANYYNIEKVWWENQLPEFKNLYELFLYKISAKEDFILEDGYFVRFRENNDKLIIGSSGVVWCGNTMGDELDKYGFDVVGFGGIPDNMMKDWVSRINKKYNKIIYFSSINTLDVCSYYNLDTINDTIFEAVVTTMMDAANKILVSGGHLSYVLIKYLPYDEKENDKERVEFCKRFNKMAKELNDVMRLVNVFKIDIKYPMTKEYSKGYVHYNNKVVWDDVLKNVE